MDAPVRDQLLDDDLVAWLADATHTPPDQVAEELTLGARRRAFVVEELLDAGLDGGELLEVVMRLTGLEQAAAQKLIRGTEPDTAKR